MEAKKTKRAPARRKTAAAQSSAIQIPKQLKGAGPIAMILGAAAVGGALYYFANPTSGAERRSSFMARLKSFGSMSSDGIMSQLSAIAGTVSSLFASWRSTAEDVTSEAQSKLEEAKTDASSYARRATAQAEDYVATH